MALAENYTITIHDKHTVFGEQSESTTSILGDLSVTDEGYTISYRELGGEFRGHTTKIIYNADRSVCLSRTGGFTTDLMLEPGKRHNCHYDTPYGGMMMGVSTHRINSNMNKSGGELEFSYTLDMDGGSLSDNELHIEVKEISNV